MSAPGTSSGIPVLILKEGSSRSRGREAQHTNIMAAKIVAETVIPIDKAEETWTASIHFNLETASSNRETLIQLHDIIMRHPGPCRAYLHLRSPENTDSIVALADAFKLKAGTALIREVNGFLGYNAVETRCSEAQPLPNGNSFSPNGRKGT